jgi:hypothetical protein
LNDVRMIQRCGEGPSLRGTLQRSMKERLRRLAIVDMLLWDVEDSGGSSSNTRRSADGTGHWLAVVVHAIAAVVMQALSLSVQSCSIFLFQDTNPGPWQSEDRDSGVLRDGCLGCGSRLTNGCAWSTALVKI